MSRSNDGSFYKVLQSSPLTESITEDLLRSVARKHRNMLREVAGFMLAYGYLEPAADSKGDVDPIESTVWIIIKVLQDNGVIPKTLPYVTIQWYVVRWIVVPFIRSLLTRYRKGQYVEYRWTGM